MITAVLSAKGGVGKTTVATNLALAMHMFGNETVLVDGDFRNPNVSLHLGTYDATPGLQDVIQGRAGVMESLSIHSSGMKFIPAKLSMSYMGLKAHGLGKILRESGADMIIDSAPGINDDVMSILDASDSVVVVTTPEIPSIADALRSVELARRAGKNILGIVVNRTTKYHRIKPSEIEAVTGAQVIGIIPEDLKVMKSLLAKRPVIEAYPNSSAAVALSKVAARLSGKAYKEPRFLGIRRLFS